MRSTTRTGSVSASGPTLRRSTVLLAVLTLLLTLAGITAPGAAAVAPGRDGRLVFIRDGQVHTARPDGTDVQKLTRGGVNYRPRWAPGGARIAYVHENRWGNTDIWVMRADGSHKTRLTWLRDVNTDGGTAWGPSGARLAFAADGTLWVVPSRPNGGAPVQLLGHEPCPDCGEEIEDAPLAVDRWLAWAPDGRLAFFNHSHGQFDDAIWFYDRATREIAEGPATGADCCGYADWSDLAFGPTGNLHYSSVDYDDEFQPLPSRIVGFPSLAGDREPAPSPSGSRIAFTNGSTGVDTIYTASLDGTSRQVVGTGSQPDWQPRR